MLVPDTSNLQNIPTSMYNGSLPSSTNISGRKALYYQDPAATYSGTEPSAIYSFTISNGGNVDGYTDWKLIYTTGPTSFSNYTIHLLDDQSQEPS
jgi:hypothetical protein